MIQKTIDFFKRPDLRAEEVLKVIFRTFRSTIQDHYNNDNGKSRHYLVMKSRNLQLREFFTKGQLTQPEQPFMGPKQMRLAIEPAFFDAHFPVFFKLIFTTDANQKKFKLPVTDTTTLINQVLGNGINQKRAHQFLKNDAIQ